LKDMSMTDHLLPAGVSVAHPDRLYVGGRWIEPQGKGRIEIVSPDTETIVGWVAEANEADMDAAVAAARAAFDAGPWPGLSGRERAAKVGAMAEYLRAREPELARAWTAQVGGLASFAPMMVAAGTQNFAGMAALGERFAFAERVDTPMAAAGIIAREPVGVVAAIAPWNAPYATMAGKVAAALVAGCTVVMKPSPETPLEAYIIAEAAEAVGLPPGVLNLACGDRAASDHLVCNPGVDKVAFTGSTAVGQRIATVCGQRIARFTLELGGKSAAIVRDDFATADAAKLLASTITVMSGQVCAMLSRAIVPRKRHDELAEAIAAEMRQVRVGPSDDPATMMGPLAMKRQLERVQSYVELGRQEADLVAGGGRPPGLNRGYFMEPTLFANVAPEARIAREEIFGPVLSLIPCEDEEDAIRIANDSDYGLNGSVLTHDVEAAWRIGRRVRSGTFVQNGMRADFSLPFGGFKKSGIGREGGAEGLMSYLETKTMLLDGVPAALAG
jgi:acyl-CoA reductase-like NAD-dependent aldehyde dehydrogenase